MLFDYGVCVLDMVSCTVVFFGWSFAGGLFAGVDCAVWGGDLCGLYIVYVGCDRVGWLD